MSRFNIHAGHCPDGSGACGAVGYLYESTEARKVKNKVVQILRNEGHTVYDCTDDTRCSANQNLQRIVEKCNSHSADLDISIHLNAGGGTGCETWAYNHNRDGVADKICQCISSALGIRNRGKKYSTGLYVLKNTKAPAILIECAFVDNVTDKGQWDAEKCAVAIASAILGKVISDAPIQPSNDTFKVKVTTDALNIRSGAGTQYSVTGCIRDRGIYTILQTQGNWGKLKSGVGWISLDYTKRV